MGNERDSSNIIEVQVTAPDSETRFLKAHSFWSSVHYVTMTFIQRMSPFRGKDSARRLLCFRFSQSIKVVLKLCANSWLSSQKLHGFHLPTPTFIWAKKIVLVLPSSKSWQSQSWFSHFPIHSVIRFCLS